MAGLAGIILRKNKKINCPEKKYSFVKKQVEEMLAQISHRGTSKKELFSVDNKDFITVAGFITKEKNINRKNSRSNLMLDGKIYNVNQLYSTYIKNTNNINNENEKLQELLQNFNTSIIKKFNGPFVLVFYDKNRNVYLARDFIGRKPLYYGFSNYKDQLFYASEIKALIRHCSIIFELPPGHFIKNIGEPVSFRRLEREKYEKGFLYDFSSREDITRENDIEIINKLRNLLIKSIEKRIPKDKPGIKIGAWLSGGLDSSIISALLKYYFDDIYTFSVGFEGSKDLEAARIVAKHLGTKHKEYFLNENELFLRIPQTIFILESFDAPLVRSTLGNIILSEISSGIDIVFSGEGGDEIFAGYNYFLEFNSQHKIQTELLNSIESLHNTALQRVDRSSCYQGINIRLPMLDEDLIDYVLQIPPYFKLDYDASLTKIILRKLAEDYLPYNIVWRPKDKFWEGSGINDIIANKTEWLITDEEYNRHKTIDGGFVLRNKEELYYYNIFRYYYPKIDYNNFISFTDRFI